MRSLPTPWWNAVPVVVNTEEINHCFAGVAKEIKLLITTVMRNLKRFPFKRNGMSGYRQSCSGVITSIAH